MAHVQWKRCKAALLLFLVPAIVLPYPTPATAAAVAPLVRVSGPSPVAACTIGRSDGVVYPNAEGEPRVAASPTTAGTDHANLVAVWQQDRWSDGGARAIMAGASFDGGRTWRDVPLPFSRCVPGGLPYDRASDPWVSIGPDGTVYASAVAVGHISSSNYAPVATLVAVSHDGGRTWSDAQAIPDSGTDGPNVTADPARPAVAWVLIPTGFKGTLLSKTTDGGKSWSSPRSIIPNVSTGPNRSINGFTLLIDPRTHTFYDLVQLARKRPAKRVCRQVKGHQRCWTSKQSSESDLFFGMSSSHDEGQTWSAPRIIAQRRFVREGAIPVRDVMFSSALDPSSGRLYVVWEDARFSRGRYYEVAISSSSDGGVTWSRPAPVRRPPGQQPFEPTIAVNADGVVGVTYYTTRRIRVKTPLLSSPYPCTYWFVASRDRGEHFEQPVRLGDPFDLTTAPPKVGYFLGDYQGMAAAGSSFFPFFAMANSGNKANRTDMFATSVLP